MGYLKSVNYSARCNNSTDLRYGNFYDESVTIEIFDSTEARLTEGAFISLEIKNNPTIANQSWPEYTFYGFFKVDKVKDIKMGYSATAYNVTHELNIDYSARLRELYDNGSFPMTALSLVQDACSFAGITFTQTVNDGYSTIWQSKQISQLLSSTITVADVLRFAAEISAFNIADSANTARSVPATMPTTRGVSFVRYGSTYDHSSAGVSYYYLIAPTDGAVDTSAFDSTVSALFKQVYYKQDGFKISNSEVKKVGRVIFLTTSGEIAAQQSFSGDAANKYIISGNPFIEANNMSTAPLAYNYLNFALTNCRVGTIKMFPFFCPFKLGDRVNTTNGDGINFVFNIMEMDYSDNEVVLRATGNEYYDTAQNSYRTAEEGVTNNAAEIERLKAFVGVPFNLNPGIDVPSNADMDDYIDDGTYRVASAAVAATIANAPTTASGFNFIVKTQNANYKWQIAILNQTNAPILKRWYNNGSFGAWIACVDESYFPLSAANGGTGVTSLGALKAALGLNFGFNAVNINANSTYIFNVGNTMRGILVTSGPSTDDKNLYVFASTTGGVTSLNTINTFGGTNIVANGGTDGNITIQNNGANQITVFTIRVSGA